MSILMSILYIGIAKTFELYKQLLESTYRQSLKQAETGQHGEDLSSPRYHLPETGNIV